MRILVACALLAGCRSEPAGPDRWPEVARLATPTLPAAEGALLTSALERVTDTDVPEVALEAAIAWRKASGGLPWRGGRAIDDQRMIRAYHLGTALLDRRAEDPEAVLTVLYLAQRFRAEGPSLLDVTVGFTLAGKVAAKGIAATPAYAAFAPTEAEARRAIPADALQLDTMLPADDKSVGPIARRAYADMVVGAPTERAAYIRHVEVRATKAQKSEVLRIVISPKLPVLLGEMFQTIDTYQAWLRARPSAHGSEQVMPGGGN